MAGVFGTPVTVETLRATGEYREPISQRDVADYAIKMMNAGNKDVEAVKYVDNLKDRYKDGITTKCLIYNATGATLTFDQSHDWHGHIYESPYPFVIQNGQWGAFIHVKSFMVGSAGAVVYRSKVPSSSSNCDWLFSWSIPYMNGVSGHNRVYTEIREEGHFPKHWDYIYHQKLEYSDRHSVDKQYGYESNTSIGEGTTAEARAIFKYP